MTVKQPMQLNTRSALKMYQGEEVKPFILSSLGKHSEDHKANLKRKHYDSKETNAAQYKKCLKDISRDQWISLIHYWNSDAGKKRSEINKRNRSCQKLAHTIGTKSFASLQYEETCKSLTQQESGRADFFVKTHTRKDGLR